MHTYHRYTRHYSDYKLKSKMQCLPMSGCDSLLGHVVVLWALVKNPSTPRTLKVLLTGVLGYVVLTFDLAPDVIPVVGWLDDLAAVTGALGYVQAFLTPEIKAEAERKIAHLTH